MKQPKPKPTITMPARALSAALAFVMHARATDSHRVCLNGVYIGESGGKSAIVGCTDGFRMAVRQIAAAPENTNGELDFTLHGEDAKALLNNLRDTNAGECTIAKHDSIHSHSAVITIGKEQHTVPLIDETYPNFQAVLPVNNDKGFEISREECEQIVRRFTAADPKGKQTHLYFHTPGQKWWDTKEMEENGKADVAFALNRKFFADILAAFASVEKLIVSFLNGSDAVLISPKNNADSRRAVIMPIRL